VDLRVLKNEYFYLRAFARATPCAGFKPGFYFCSVEKLLRYGLFSLHLTACMAQLKAQPAYKGVRAAVFDVQILQQKGQNISLRCRMANTGRAPLGIKRPTEEVVVEFDTAALPPLLRGHEAALAEAAKNGCPKLKPGEVSEPIWLNLKLLPRVWQGAEGCAELRFDTVFVEEWGNRAMRLRYFIKNTGSVPAHLFTKRVEPIVNVYFVSGDKLTRGAIPAGNTRIRKGRETLDGVLFPGQVLEGSVEFGLENRTKFSPNIALELDPAQAVEECSRAGNVWVLRLRY
jgi:hypothetical protein